MITGARTVCMYRTQVVWVATDALYVLKGRGIGGEIGVVIPNTPQTLSTIQPLTNQQKDQIAGHLDCVPANL